MAADLKLVASLICHEEMGRYLQLVIADLQTYCDEIRVLDDASTDGSFEWLAYQEGVEVLQLPSRRFFVHEGQARDMALRWALEANGSHYLTVDCDETVADGRALRAAVESSPDIPVWSLEMQEIWSAGEDGLCVRLDGGWRPHPLPILWKGPRDGERFTMRDKKLACGRLPTQVLTQRSRPSGVDVLHWGWTDPEARQKRYERYAKHDGGRFHASRHLQSIMWDDSRVKLRPRPWPDGPVFDSLRDRFAAVNA